MKTSRKSDFVEVFLAPSSSPSFPKRSLAYMEPVIQHMSLYSPVIQHHDGSLQLEGWMESMPPIAILDDMEPENSGDNNAKGSNQANVSNVPT